MENSDAIAASGINSKIDDIGIATGDDTSESSNANGSVNPGDNAKPRGRGRPSGTKRGGLGGTGNTGTGKSSGTTKPAEKKTSIFVDKQLLGRQLVGIHAMAAMMLKEPIISIETAEGEALAKSLIDISEYYGLTASRGVMLWVNLAGTAAMIYGGKILTIARRPKQPKAPKQNTNVADINQPPTMNFAGG